MVLAAFSRLVGQRQAVELLSSAIAQERIAPAYLFVGPAGVGRSLAARGFLESLIAPLGVADTAVSAQQQRLLGQNRLRQGNHADVLWVEPTYLHQGKRLPISEVSATDPQRPRSRPQIRIEQVREITRFLSRPPLMAPRAVVVLEQAETLSEAAANGLLKTLEEPGQATLILLAESAAALLPTLVSRCQQIPFRRLTLAQMAQVLEPSGYAEVLSLPQVMA
ncbi:MAG TPA: hypothetical protein V6D03_11260, partial [Candidatus Caenarcaniphilales bacterium]